MSWYIDMYMIYIRIVLVFLNIDVLRCDAGRLFGFYVAGVAGGRCVIFTWQPLAGRFFFGVSLLRGRPWQAGFTLVCHFYVAFGVSFLRGRPWQAGSMVCREGWF